MASSIGNVVEGGKAFHAPYDGDAFIDVAFDRFNGEVFVEFDVLNTPCLAADDILTILHELFGIGSAVGLGGCCGE